MAFDPQVLLRSGVKANKNKLNKSHDVICTQDFGFPLVVMFDELIPGDNVHLNASLFSRLAPMVAPTFGDVRIELNAFFVPFRLLQPGVNEMIEQTNYAKPDGISSLLKTHYSSNNVMVQVLADMSVAGTAQEYDFCLYSNGSYRYYKFTVKSKRIYTLLQALGYGLNFSLTDKTEMSMLPLLSYARVFADYLVSPNYRNNTIDKINRYFVQYSTINFTDFDLLTIFDFTYMAMYEPDFYTSAWQDNNKPGNATSYVTVPDPYSKAGFNDDADNARITVDGKDIRLQLVDEGVPATPQTWQLALSNYGMKIFQSIADKFTRLNFLGSRWFDRQAGEIGVTPKYARHDQSVFLGSYQSQVQISDVMATATVDQGSELGDYAGKGISYFNNGHFECEVDERGYIIVISTIRPRIQYYQGRDRHVFHLSALDFWTPDLDNKGMQPIRNDELFSGYIYDGVSAHSWSNIQSYGGRPDGIFGFSPRLSEYAYKNSKVLGDFNVRTLMTGLDAYHLFRNIPMPSPTSPLVLDEAFTTMTDSNQYDRIFNVGNGGSSSGIDHFYNTYHFDYKIFSYKKSINDHTDIAEGSDNKVVQVRNGGRHV